jgi:hypothetical protein
VLNVKQGESFLLHLLFLDLDLHADLRVEAFRLDVIFHYINIRAFHNLENGLVELESFFDRNFDVQQFVFPLNKLVQRPKLTHILFAEPLAYFGELGSD